MALKEGKLPAGYLEKLLKILPSLKREVKTGPCIGGDSAVIKLKDFYIVVAQDPITFTEEDIGYYGVIVNANDVAVMGAKPLYFLFTLLLPEKISEDKIKKVFEDVSKTCRKLNITVVGGHTEIAPNLKKVILSGTMLGIRPVKKGVFPKKVKDGDLLFCVREVPIEGVSIIAKERKDIVEKIIGKEEAEKFSKYHINPGISVVREAVLISEFEGTLAMHDPTEGGIWNGIWEFSEFLKKGVLVYREKISLIRGFEKVFEYFRIDPMKTISSGSLLVAVKRGYDERFEKLCKSMGVKTNLIGVFENIKKGRYMLEDNKKTEIFSCQDDISKIF